MRKAISRTVLFPIFRALAAFAFTVILYPLSALAEENPEVVLRYFSLTSGRLAFSYQREEKKDIWLIDFEKLVIAPLVQTAGNDECPQWSPDGTRLLFHSDVSGDTEIYSVKYDGSEMTRLTDSPGADEAPDWSPDGTKIVFQSSRLSRNSSIFIMNADGSDPRVLVRSRKRAITPRWSPRGTEVLFATNETWPGWDISLFTLGSGTTAVLTSGYNSFSRPAWAPDGASFAVCYGSGKSIEIWRHQKGEKELKPLITRPGRNQDPCWSDDQKSLFFVGETSAGSTDSEIYLYNFDSEKSEQLTKSRGIIRHLSWTPLPALDSLAEQIEKSGGETAAAEGAAANLEMKSETRSVEESDVDKISPQKDRRNEKPQA